VIPAVPKAELHVHLEGTAKPELVRRIAARNGLALPPGLFADDETFAWRDFLDFLNTYDLAASVIRTARDYRDIVFAYLSDCAAEGAIYVELISSPDHARAVGLTEEEHRAGLFHGIDDARAAHGIEGRIIVVAIRNFGPEAAERTAAEAAALPHPYVVGFNLAGDEAGYPPPPFTRAFEIARDAGQGCTVHAGEHAGPQSVEQALALPGVTRISHGVRAVEDPSSSGAWPAPGSCWRSVRPRTSRSAPRCCRRCPTCSRSFAVAGVVGRSVPPAADGVPYKKGE